MDPVRSKMRGPQEFIDTVVKLRNAITDLRYQIIETVTSNEKVVAIVEVTGKHTGTFFGFIPPSGNRISYQATHFFTIGEDSKL
jgi:predicted ester cyclase